MIEASWRVRCQTCGGERYIDCPACRGQSEWCQHCQGSALICPACYGSAEVTKRSYPKKLAVSKDYVLCDGQPFMNINKTGYNIVDPEEISKINEERIKVIKQSIGRWPIITISTIASFFIARFAYNVFNLQPQYVLLVFCVLVLVAVIYAANVRDAMNKLPQPVECKYVKRTLEIVGEAYHGSGYVTAAIDGGRKELDAIAAALQAQEEFRLDSLTSRMEPLNGAPY